MKSIFVAVVLATVASGCATVDVHRVKSDDFVTEGFRYYLPRPYVAVKKPFPVAYYEGFVTGTIEEDKIRLKPSTVNEKIAHFLQANAANKNSEASDWTIDASEVTINIPPAPVKIQVNAMVAKSDETNTDDTKKKDEEETPKPAAAAPAPSQSTVPINELFDVLYLPDFEQQYAIDFESGLGTADQSFKLQHGWMLTEYAGKTDNSEVLASIGSFVGSMVSAATSLAGIGAGAVPGGDIEEPPADEDPQVPMKSSHAPSAQATKGEKPSEAKLKVILVWNALPGTYPVLKPGEIDEINTTQLGGNQLLVPDPADGAGFPFAILYKTQATVRFELVEIETKPVPDSPGGK
ncbi:MAG: hypothetical protein HYV27_21065 [Candidatus Hydrogenedentes bacterium]|nr:hypothetical protein [Candidatus Hydrogenedentota bacterium]